MYKRSLLAVSGNLRMKPRTSKMQMKKKKSRPTECRKYTPNKLREYVSDGK